MPVWTKVLRMRRIVLAMLAATVSMAKPGHAGFDPLNPLGEIRKKQIAVSVLIDAGDWGEGDARDIQLVLTSVAREFLGHVEAPVNGLKLRVVPRGGAPRALYERGLGGEYVIHLTARDQHWFQYAYQFAHELCHVVSNFDHKAMTGEGVAQDNQWFEEALCETAALFTLKRLSRAWASNPPGRDWIGYGDTFSSYAVHLSSQPHRKLAEGQSLRDWYVANRAVLKGDPYLRQKNEVVANALLPLFEAHPELWQSIAYLNTDSASASKSFPEYLADWYRACPEKTLPQRVMTQFGFDTNGHEAPPEAIAALPGGLTTH
jgi:hypothetical protein